MGIFIDLYEARYKGGKRRGGKGPVGEKGDPIVWNSNTVYDRDGEGSVTHDYIEGLYSSSSNHVTSEADFSAYVLTSIVNISPQKSQWAVRIDVVSGAVGGRSLYKDKGVSKRSSGVHRAMLESSGVAEKMKAKLIRFLKSKKVIRGNHIVKYKYKYK